MQRLQLTSWMQGVAMSVPVMWEALMLQSTRLRYPWHYLIPEEVIQRVKQKFTMALMSLKPDCMKFATMVSMAGMAPNMRESG